MRRERFAGLEQALGMVLVAALGFLAPSCEEVEMTYPNQPDEEQSQDPDDDPKPDDDPDPGPATELIYYDNLDGGTPSNNPYLDQWQGFINATGTGADNVKYSGRSIQSRDTYPSRDYSGASGANAFYSNATNAYVIISGITLPAGITTFQFSFGSLGSTDTGSFTANTDIVLEVGNEAGTFVPLKYSRTSGTQQWALCKTVFTVSGTVPRKISFKLTAATRYIRIDDLRLETSSETADCTVTFGTAPTVHPWAEIPETVTESSDYKYITHHATTITTGQRVRNFVSCYDTRRHNPMWVAHIHHDCYCEGGYTRPNPDPWRPDPLLSESEQSIIYPTDWADWTSGISNWPTDDYYYWSPANFSYPKNSDGKNVSITKGHMVRSADRGGVGKDLNMQTFYPTNISPELYLHSNTWNIVEGALSDDWTCSDTTYVVTGCYYGNDSHELIDASNWGNRSSLSKTCIMPVARYRVILRTKSGNLNKPVAECSADELISIGFWFPQALEGQAVYEETDKSQWIFSVADIEKKIGGEFNFFPTVPAAVKEQRNLSDWGLE